MTAMLDEPTRSAVREPASQDACELTILMPCLNEAETLERCIRKARSFLIRGGIYGEVVIADNGSTDGSQGIAEAAGARVVPIIERGYGAPLLGGIRAARGRYVMMGDSDDSYDFVCLDAVRRAKLREGYELVMGNRFKGGILPGAMPPLHRYLGNPMLTTVGRLFFEPGAAISIAACAASIASAIAVARPAGHRHGIRQRNGGEGDDPRSAHRRGADDTVARWPLATAAFAKLAGWLAASALPAAVQPALAVPVSGLRAVRRGVAGDGLAAAAVAAGRRA